MSSTIYTIGHSTRELSDFIEILKIYNIEQLVDVRTVPKSRHVPQFNHDNLQEKLPEQNIEYIHLEKLGGLRHVLKDSINQGWHNKSFRGYADYMQTDGFLEGIKQLESLAEAKQVAIMCAEAVPWRCHRSMVGDALLVREFKVIDIFDAKKTQNETLTSFAKVDSENITYPDDGIPENKETND
jgi:uncharacterized protein (DUF488 family)